MKRGKKLLLFMSLLLAATVQARIHYVSPEGDDQLDGQSWSQARRDLQTVLDSCSPDDEVWLRGGTYIPTAHRPWTGPRLHAESFVLPPDVRIYGSFAGTETSPEERELADRDGNGLVELWEFANPTIWQHSDDYAGNVAVTSNDVATGGLLDGITFTNGQAVGTGNDGYGGGLLVLNGTMVSACVFERNLAYSGAGLAILGPGAAVNCRLSLNYAMPGEGGGGGAYLRHDGASLVNCLLVRNESDNGGAGLVLAGQSRADFCTIVANVAHSAGAGVHLVAGTLTNSLVWGNSGPSQVRIDAEGTVRRCGLAGGLVGEGILPLQELNSDYQGPAFNANAPDQYFVCFSNHIDGDYSLAAGSYAINRALPEDVSEGMTDVCGNPRSQRGLPDLGAYESAHPGCLAVRTFVERPILYGSTNRVTPQWGMLTPEDINISFSFDKSWAEINANRDSFSLSGQHAGRVKMTTYAISFDDDWQNHQITSILDVYRRSIEVTVASVTVNGNQETTDITASVSAGSLLPGDNLSGTPSESGAANGWLITQGTIQIDDHNQGNNYNIEFRGKKAPVNSSITDYVRIEFMYGDPFPSEIGIGFFEDPVTGQMVLGDYEVLTDVSSPLSAGHHNIECVFHPEDGDTYTDVYFHCPVEVYKNYLNVSIAATEPRYYGQENPEYTIVYDGFVGGDDASCLTGTAVIQGAPGLYDMPGDYFLYVDGISSDNYEIYNMLAIQQVLSLPTAVQGEITASTLQEGETLNGSVLSGTIINPMDNSVVDGMLIWSDFPDFQPPVGTSRYAWTFLPNDLCYSYLYGEVEVTVLPNDRQLSTFSAPLNVIRNSLSILDNDDGGDKQAEDGVETTTVQSPNDVTPTVLTDVQTKTTLQTLVIRPLASGKTYGDDDPATFPWQLDADGLPDGVTITGELEREPGESCGDYAFTLGTLTVDNGYALELQPAVFQIRPRRINLLTGDYRKMLGEDDPELSWMLLESEWAEEVNITGRLSREPGEEIGTYRLSASDLACDENFLLTVSCGNLHIDAAGFKARDLMASELVYGDRLSASALVGQVIFTDGQIPQDGTFQWENPESLVPAGNSEQPWIFCFAEADKEPLRGTVSLSVRPKELTITSLNVTKLPGDDDPPLPYTYDAEALKGLPCAISGSLERQPGELPGTYATTLGTLSFGDNFRLEFEPASLRILADKTVIDDDWADWLEPGDIVTVNGRDFTFGGDAFASIEDALTATAPGGTILLASGAYALPTDGSVWQAPHPVSLRGLQDYDEEAACVLLNPLNMTRNDAWMNDDERAVITIDNLQIQTADNTDFALRIGDFRSASLASCALSGGARTLLADNLLSLEITSCTLSSSGTCLTLGLPEPDDATRGIRDFTIRKNDFCRLTSDAFYLQVFDDHLNGTGLGIAYCNSYDGFFADGESDDTTVTSLKQFVGDRETPDWPCQTFLRLRKEVLTAIPSANDFTLGDENLTLRLVGEDGRLVRNLHGKVQAFAADGTLLGESPLVYSREHDGYSLVCPAITPETAALRFTGHGQAAFCQNSAVCQISVQPPAIIDALTFLANGTSAIASNDGDYQGTAGEALPLNLQASYGIWSWSVAKDETVEYALPAEGLTLITPGIVTGTRADQTYSLAASYQGQTATTTIRFQPAPAVSIQAHSDSPHLVPGGWTDLSLIAVDAYGNQFPVPAEEEHTTPETAGDLLTTQRLLIHQDYDGSAVVYSASSQGLGCSLELPVEMRLGEIDDWQLSCDGAILLLQCGDYHGPAVSGWYNLEEQTRICLECSDLSDGRQRTVTCRLIGYEREGENMPLTAGFAVPSLTLITAEDGKTTLTAAAGRHEDGTVLELEHGEQSDILPCLALTSSFSDTESSYAGCLLLER